MNKNINFSKTKDLLVKLALDQGETIDAIKHPWNPETEDLNWHWMCEEAKNEELNADWKNLYEAIRLYDLAYSNGDLITARCGLTLARLAALNISSYFDALSNDLTKLVLDRERFKWPDSPASYSIPEFYKYSGTVVVRD